MIDRKRFIWWSVLGVLVIVAAFRLLLPGRSNLTVEQGVNSREIVVYITGAVETAGLLNLPLDARLDDALQAAGLKPEADFEALNPAQRLKDGQKIIVPYKQSSLSADGAAMPTSPEGAAPPGDSLPGAAWATTQQGYRININAASLEELQKITGIGPVLAQRVIDYRQEQGLFTSPEDVQNVSGIGPKTYEKMADQISVGP